MHPGMHAFLRCFRHSRLSVATALVAALAATALFTAPRAGAGEQSVYAYGDAKFLGSTGLVALNEPVVGMARTPDGNGYWLASSDGRIASFGNAVHHGNVPIVDIRLTLLHFSHGSRELFVLASHTRQFATHLLDLVLQVQHAAPQLGVLVVLPLLALQAHGFDALAQVEDGASRLIVLEQSSLCAQ